MSFKEICKKAMKTISLDNQNKMMKELLFLEIRVYLPSEEFRTEIKQISKNNLGDWYEYVMEYNFNGILIFIKCNHIHQLIDYSNENDIEYI